MTTVNSSGMATSFTRVTPQVSRNVVLGDLRRAQEELFRIQEQLSSGFMFNRPSEDPIAADRVQNYSLRLSVNAQFVNNIQVGNGRLQVGDVALEQANEIANQAREIFLAQNQSTATAQTRLLASQEIASLLQEAVNLGNTRYDGQYLFGGSRTTSTPFVFAGNDVAFRGDLTPLGTDVADGLRVATNLSADVFGAVSEEIRGLDATTLQPIDLNPRVTASTSLSDLNQGRGVTLGTIQITGSASASVNLRYARTVGDVLDLINAQTGATGVTASINPAQNGLRFTSAGPAITVADAVNGRTAADLGIVMSAAPSGTDGTDLDPRLTEDTLLGDLFAGAGLDPSGIVITQQSATQTRTATFGASVFSATARVEDLLTAINGSEVEVVAGINEDGTGIDILSRLSGARLTISENGGTTAADLGLLSTLGRARLVDLHAGKGLGTVEGTDLRITRKDGTVLTYDLDRLTSVQQFVAAVNADADLTATITAGGQIVITDTSAAAGTMTIEDVNGSFAATNLGIAGSVTGAGAQTITGTAVPFGGIPTEGILTALLWLKDALASNDGVALNTAGRMLDTAQEKILDARGVVGSRIASLELTSNRLSLENVELEKLRSSTRDADLAEVATRFQLQQTALQAALSSAATILKNSLLEFL